jgi:heme-degrading monooxygenase HmoA
MARNNLESLRKAKIARIWQGRTTNAKADEYEKYMYEAGINKIAATEGNLGVQMMRHSKGGITEFITISYWASRDDIKRYAGEDIEKPHHLPKDAEYLLELPESVKNCDLITNDWK